MLLTLLLASCADDDIAVTVPPFDLAAHAVRLPAQAPLPVCLGYHPDAGSHVVP